MIYKIVAIIGVIFLIIFGLVVYSALTLPAKTLVRVTSPGAQQVLIVQPASSALHPTAGPTAQLHFGSQESLTARESHAFTSISPNIYESYPQVLSGPLIFTQLTIPPSARFYLL
jgi:hypothetical protein